MVLVRGVWSLVGCFTKECPCCYCSLPTVLCSYIYFCSLFIISYEIVLDFRGHTLERELQAAHDDVGQHNTRTKKTKAILREQNYAQYVFFN